MLIIIRVLVYRCVKKRTEHGSHEKCDTFVNFNTTPDKFKLTSTPDTTRTSAKSEDDGVEIRFFPRLLLLLDSECLETQPEN